MLLTILIIVYVLIALFIIMSLLIHGIRPSKTLAWLLAIFTIPVGGILLYLMLGRNRRKIRLTRLKGATLRLPRLTDLEWPGLTSTKYRKIMQLVASNCQFAPTAGNDLELLKDGKTTFNSIFPALEKATAYIHVQYYIFEDGALADRLLELFRRKVAAGVKVRLIYDVVGSYTLSGKYLANLKAYGVEVYPFLPFRFGRFLTALNYRNHRKIIIVDGKVGFTGGINISDKYLKGDERLGMWHDMHIRIEGPAVKYLDYVFETDWFMVSEQKLDTKLPSPVHKEEVKPSIVQVAYSGPDEVFPNIEQIYFSMIGRANQYVYITNPYIIPSQEILKALQVAALAGVDVRLMISKKSDSKLVRWSVQSYFEPLLKSGVRIFLFPDGFLHSKIMVSDDDIASIGTANIDVRSFEHNYEVNAVVYDPAFAEKLRLDFIEDCENCRELIFEEYLKRPLNHKLLEGVARVFTPIL